jgi:hypothetical protein
LRKRLVRVKKSESHYGSSPEGATPNAGESRLATRRNDRETEVEGQRILTGDCWRKGFEFSGSMAKREEAGEAAGLGFITIHGQGGIAETAGVGDMILTAAEGPLIPGVHQIERQRSLHGDGGMQGFGGSPGAETHRGHVFARGTGGVQRDGVTIAGDAVP